MARVHRHERGLGQVGAHGIGVVGGDAHRADLLQQDGLQIDQMDQRSGDVEDRLSRADPLALRVAQIDLEPGVAALGHGREFDLLSGTTVLATYLALTWQL